MATNSSSSLDKVFFSQENYKKFSCLPSLVEFLGKHLNSSTRGEDGSPVDSRSDPPKVTNSSGNGTDGGSNRNNEGKRSFSLSTSLSPEMEFPFVSKISRENQKLLLETFEMIKSGDLANADFQKLKSIQEIKAMVVTEQEEFQKFVYNHAKVNHYLFNFIHPDVWDTLKSEMESKYKASVGKYPKRYCLHETIGLAVGAVYKSGAVLTFEQTLQQTGSVPLLKLPKDVGIILTPEFLATKDKEIQQKEVTEMDHKVVSEDPLAASLARKHKVDIVISSSGFSTLLDNQPPDYKTQWQLPIIVRRQQEDQNQVVGQKVVFIDKPLPPQSFCPRAVNWKFYKQALRKMTCVKPCEENAESCNDTKANVDSDLGREGAVDLQVKSESCGSERTLIQEFASTRTTTPSRNRLADSGEGQGNELKKTKVAKSNLDDKTGGKEGASSRKYFVYNLWKFGNLRVLIRCSMDAHRANSEKTNSFTFFSVLPKLEYQLTFGHERLTYSETAQMWLHCYLRPQTKLICGRFNVFSSELLRIDELSLCDVLQHGTGFNPAQGMKLAFQVFQALKRLPESHYILSHKCSEMHACLYKSQRLLGSSAPKSSFDLQKEKSPVINNYTEAEIPWVAIDCNLFLPWQIHEKRIPCTFPSVPAKELALILKNEKESPPKKKKKKKSKKKTGQAKRIASDNCNPQATSKQISVSEREGTSSNQKAQGQTSQGVRRPNRKSIDKSRLLATFYDVKPAEKESEVFAVARRSSGPVTYDDVDF
ncbi:little elongation complex subunit 2-like [Acropora millepora]|uniref:little elongation complex subunit 2-like n=1 Tax=Acropora millepora TaxID=45264 RepID=UPI001CF3EF09|nr:little elongation complex subunit 2-like [Acropora millepora]